MTDVRLDDAIDDDLAKVKKSGEALLASRKVRGRRGLVA